MKRSIDSFIPLPDGRRIRQLRLFIHQPQLSAEPFEAVVSIKDLLAFADEVGAAAARCETAAKDHASMDFDTWVRTYINQTPNEYDCGFCRAAATCPTSHLRVLQETEMLGPLEDLDTELPPKTLVKDQPIIFRERARPYVPVDVESLDRLMRAAPFIEGLLKEVRAEVERQALAGTVFPSFGLELGRKGAKRFTDPEAVKVLLREKFRLPAAAVFKQTLKTPTQLEDLLEPTVEADGTVTPPLLKKRRWEQVTEFITFNEAKPSVKRKELIKKPYTPTPPSALAALPDDDEPETLW